jgi:hypothetical protein
MHLNNALGDAQAETAPLDLIIVGGIASVKGFEHMGELFRREGVTGISDAEFRGIVFAAESEGHETVRTAVLDRVVGEIEQQLAEAVPIPAHSNFIALG